MQIQIVDKNIKLGENQVEYIQDKLLHLKSFGQQVADESTRVRVDVESNKMKTSNKNITVQVTMYPPHAVIRAEVYGITVEEAIDIAVEKLKKQLERYKGKMHRRDKNGKWIQSSTLEAITDAQKQAEEMFKIEKRKNFSDLSPMHEEEAIEQLELLDHNFYTYINIETGKFNVVYRREDGSYGLIDFDKKS